MGHAVRVVTDDDPEMIVLSIDDVPSFNLGQDARSVQSATPVAFRQTDIRTGIDGLVG